mmetsp:Transcript_272/g.938  ORF Transcript_272/g.938 Transcript_272/m.938 type:complete len:233 (+) Transcript_272:173-871(+)
MATFETVAAALRSPEPCARLALADEVRGRADGALRLPALQRHHVRAGQGLRRSLLLRVAVHVRLLELWQWRLLLRHRPKGLLLLLPLVLLLLLCQWVLCPTLLVEVMRGIKQALQQPPFAGGPREALEPAAGVERHWRGNAAGGALKDVAANRKPRRPAQVKSETAIELFGDIVDERVHLAVPARRRVPRNGPRGELGRSGTMNVCPSEGPRRSCEAVVHLRGASARGVRHE